jgi:uncharacterized iron-regulated membrane protein
VTFRALLLWIHLILGLTGAIVIAIASVTGAYIVLQVPLERLLIPVPQVVPSTAAPDIAAMVRAVEAQYAPRRVTHVKFADGRAAVLTLSDRSRAFVDPGDGSIVRFRQLTLVSFENFSTVMRRLHVNLLLGPKGRLVVTLATIEALLLALTGLWLWWRKKHWKFTRWRGSVYRVSWDLHNASGLWFLVPALAMIITGVLLYFLGPLAPPEAGYTSVPTEGVVRISLPEGRRPGPTIERLTITGYVVRATGDVVHFPPPGTPTGIGRVVEVSSHLHTGDLLGVTGMTVMALGCVMLAVMTVTGAILGWKRILILARKRPDD